MNAAAAVRAAADMFTLSVRMYVMRPASYRRCAIDIVRCGENPHAPEAVCCSVEVVNGGSARRVRGTVFTSATRSTDMSRSSTIMSALPRLSTAGFSPSKRARRAQNAGAGALRVSTPISQYSAGLKASISRSRSETSLSAADCTRPAESV